METSYQFTCSLEYKNIKHICHCYLLFTNNDKKYLQYLNWTRINCCPIYINDKKIMLRHVLQNFDHEFNKLVIRIRTSTNNNNINVSWEEYNKKYPNFDKSELYNFLEQPNNINNDLNNDFNNNDNIYNYGYPKCKYIK
mgnify:FL=1